MKQNIIMIIILVILFFFGLVIYDFSDELDKNVTSNSWYHLDEQMTMINFKNLKFSYVYKDSGEKISHYQGCSTYRFNQSINVIKLNCGVKGNKLYISQLTDNELILTVDGVDKTFYKNENKAIEAAFMQDNNFTQEDFDKFINFDLSKFTNTDVNEIQSLYKSKDVKLVAFINGDKTINNTLNLNALYNISKNSEKSLITLNYDNLSESDLAKLTKLNSDLKTLDKDITPIYIVGNKSFKLATNLEVKTFSEIKDYKDI